MTPRAEGCRNGPAGRRLLVTGASGFIGARLCERACDRGGGGAWRFAGTDPGVASAALRWEHVDLTDEGATRALVRRVQPDVVLHLASEVGVATAARTPSFPCCGPTSRRPSTVMVASTRPGTGTGGAGLGIHGGAGSWRRRGRWPSRRMPRANNGRHSRMPACSAPSIELPVVHLRIFMVGTGPGRREPAQARSLTSRRRCSAASALQLTSVERGRWTGSTSTTWSDAFLAAAVTPGADGASRSTSGRIAARSVPVRGGVAPPPFPAALVGGHVEPSFGGRSIRPEKARARPRARIRRARRRGDRLAAPDTTRRRARADGRGSTRALGRMEPHPAVKNSRLPSASKDECSDARPYIAGAGPERSARGPAAPGGRSHSAAGTEERAERPARSGLARR